MLLSHAAALSAAFNDTPGAVMDATLNAAPSAAYCATSDQAPGAVPGKTLYLTFDDGPSDQYTPRLLDLLDDLHIPASFFVVGAFAAKNPALLARMADSGHTIGLHSYAHKSAYLMTCSQAKKDFEKSVAVLRSLDIRPRLFRPPWGHTRSFTLDLARDLGLSPAYWTVMAQDWKAFQSPAETARRLLDRITPGAVICLHDGRGRRNAPGRMLCALETVLPTLLDQGYHFQVMTKDTCPTPLNHTERKPISL